MNRGSQATDHKIRVEYEVIQVKAIKVLKLRVVTTIVAFIFTAIIGFSVDAAAAGPNCDPQDPCPQGWREVYVDCNLELCLTY